MRNLATTDEDILILCNENYLFPLFTNNGVQYMSWCSLSYIKLKLTILVRGFSPPYLLDLDYITCGQNARKAASTLANIGWITFCPRSFFGLPIKIGSSRYTDYSNQNFVIDQMHTLSSSLFHELLHILFADSSMFSLTTYSYLIY